MKSIKEYAQEMYDIRNRMLTEAHVAKYYTVKQSIALLKKNLEGIEDEDDKAHAVYNALGSTQISGYDVVNGTASKIIVKDHHYDNYSSAKASDKAFEKHGKKYKEAFDAIMKDSTIADLYERGKEVHQRKLKEEAEAKKEAERLAKNKAYKEFCDEYKGAHLLFKAWALNSAYTENNLWSTPKDSLYSILIDGMNGCKHIKASEAEPGKYYAIAGRMDAPNVIHKKDYKPSGRWDIIKELSIVKCVGDDKWNIIMSRSDYAYKEPNMNQSKIDQYFDKNTDKIEDGIKRYIDMIKDDLKYDKAYSSLIMSLIEKNEIA